MESVHNLINTRIAWCRRQREQASTESEADGWRAEEDGLRDALLNKNYADAYRLSSTVVFQRYMLGFQDGTALLSTAQIAHMTSPAEGLHLGTCIGQDGLPGDER